MPIRFRCVYCDKLLGIAKRKAGAVVNCPQCGQPLIVPTPEGEPDSPATMPARLFERDNFDVVLQSDVTLAATENAPPPTPPKRSKVVPPPIPSPLPQRPFAVEQNLPAPPRDYPAPLPLPVPKRAPGLSRRRRKERRRSTILMWAFITAFVVFQVGVFVYAFSGSNARRDRDNRPRVNSGPSTAHAPEQRPKRESNYPDNIGDRVRITRSALMGTSRDDLEEGNLFLRARDNAGMAEMVLAGRLCFIDEGTEGILLEGGLFTMRVRITSGPCAGRAGYIVSEFVRKKPG